MQALLTTETIVRRFHYFKVTNLPARFKPREDISSDPVA